MKSIKVFRDDIGLDRHLKITFRKGELLKLLTLRNDVYVTLRRILLCRGVQILRKQLAKYIKLSVMCRSEANSSNCFIVSFSIINWAISAVNKIKSMLD